LYFAGKKLPESLSKLRILRALEISALEMEEAAEAQVLEKPDVCDPIFSIGRLGTGKR
jgi:hypothetical protein